MPGEIATGRKERYFERRGEVRVVDVGTVGLKLMGVYFIVYGVAQTAPFLAMFAVLGEDVEMPSWSTLALTAASSLFPLLAGVVLCALGGRVSRLLFGGENGTLEWPADVAAVGVGLIGLWAILEALPGVVTSLHALYLAWTPRMAFSCGGRLAQMFGGVVCVVYAPELGTFLRGKGKLVERGDDMDREERG